MNGAGSALVTRLPFSSPKPVFLIVITIVFLLFTLTTPKPSVAGALKVPDTALPLTVTVLGECFASLLVIVRLPESAPAEVGANRITSFSL